MKKTLISLLVLLFLAVSSVSCLAGQLLPYPKFKATDSVGVPYSGGKLYTYAPGTSTAKAAYTDVNLSTAAANPIVLDSSGEAAVYLKGKYKLILKTSADVTVWTLDNVQGMGDWEEGKYYVDAAETDQGATGAGNSIAAHLATIGSKNAIMKLANTSGSATTSYTVSTAITIPANVTVEVEPGALIVEGTGSPTVTINGGFKADPGRQVFSGWESGDITFGPNTVKEVYPQWWGNNTTPGTTDMATAINCAINAGVGRVYFIPGIYAIGSTITLKSATEYIGPGGGTYIPSQEHPSSGYGAALKWTGAASGTMVAVDSLWHVKWDGIDLDGVDYTNDVTGFNIISDNDPTSQTNLFQNFSAFNLGYGAKIGSNSGGTHYQVDANRIQNFWFYKCNYGIYYNSQNASQGNIIEHGKITVYTSGIYLNNGGGLLQLNGILFSAVQNAPAAPGGSFIYVNAIGSGGLSIRGLQGETGAYTGWRDILTADVALTMPITLISNVFNRGIVTLGTNLQRIVSIGNTFDTSDNQAVSLTGNKEFISTGDTFAASETVAESGTNNLITYMNPYWTGGTTNQFPYTFRYNASDVYKLKYEIPTYADNAAALAGGLTAGTVYRTSTGTMMVVYSP